MIENWIIPCNLKHFDLVEHFKTHETVVWKNAFTIHQGDNAYIYLSAPYSEIRYRCKVISDVIDEKILQNNAYAIPETVSHNYFAKKLKFIEMLLEYEYPQGILTLDKLKIHGLGQVQIQARTNRQLQNYINQITPQYEKTGKSN